MPVPERERPVYGPQTYKEFMDDYYAEEMERFYNPKPLDPWSPPPGWDLDLWTPFAISVNAERRADAGSRA